MAAINVDPRSKGYQCSSVSDANLISKQSKCLAVNSKVFAMTVVLMHISITQKEKKLYYEIIFSNPISSTFTASSRNSATDVKRIYLEREVGDWTLALDKFILWKLIYVLNVLF